MSKLKFLHFVYCHGLTTLGLLYFGFDRAVIVALIATVLILFPLASIIVHQHFNHGYSRFRNCVAEWASMLLLITYSFWPLREMKSYHISHHSRWLQPTDPTASEIAQGKCLYYLGLTNAQPFDRFEGTFTPSFEFASQHFWLLKLVIYLLLLVLFGLSGLFYVVIIPQFFIYVLSKIHDLVFHSTSNAQDCAWLFPLYFNDCWHIEHHESYDQPQTWHWPWLNVQFWYHELLFLPNK